MARSSLTTIAAAALLSLLALACAARPPAASTYPLLDQTVHASGGSVSGRVPMGWTASASDPLPPGVEAWLISEDRGAFMALREINLDRPTGQRVRQEGLELLARLSLAFRSDSGRPAASVPVRASTLGRTNVCSYELSGGGEWKNVIVLALSGRYYECEANVAKGGPDVARRVAEAQRAFCGSLTTSSRE